MLYVCIHVFFREEIIYILNNNLPFRQAYFPSFLGILFIYIMPLLLGFYIAGSVKKPKAQISYYINLGLISGLLYYLPFIFVEDLGSYWFDSLAITYSFMLFPFIFILGSVPHALDQKENVEEEDTNHKNAILTKFDYLIGSIIGLIAGALNYIVFASTRFLAGADVYYHAAMTSEILRGHPITSSPYFFEGKNYYYSIIYYIMAGLSKYGHIDLLQIWMVYYLAICSGIFFFFFYLFVKKITNNYFTSVIATLFVLPINQLIWTDPSIRNASYAFFIIFIYSFYSYMEKKEKKYLFLSLIFFALIASTHPEIAIHTTGILIAYLILAKTSISKFIQKYLFLLSEKIRRKDINLPALNSPRIFVILAFLYVLLLEGNIYFIIKNYAVGQVLIFNEVGLSLFQPLGIISFLVFILFPIGALKVLSSKNTANIIILSIASLGLTAVFYFTHLWIFYHRYFVETAYFAFAIFAAIALQQIASRLNNKYGFGFLFTLLFFLFLSLYPRYIFYVQYKERTNMDLSYKVEDFNMIKNHTNENDVIIINPGDMLNRYLPFYTSRYIFAGHNGITKEQQWHVLPFCSGPYSKDCNVRFDFSNRLFLSPSKGTVEEIKSNFKIDYLLVNKTNPEEVSRFEQSDIELTLVSEDNKYYLYKI